MAAPRRTLVAVAVAVAALALAASRRADAQERLHFRELPDEALEDTTFQMPDSPEEPWRFGALVDAGGDARAGADAGATPTLGAGLGLGLRSDVAHFLQLRSDALVPDAGAVGRGSFGWRDVEGFHRLRATYAFGAVREGELGADVSVQASATHATALSTSTLRPDVGPRAFLDSSAEATVWPRLGGGDDHGWVVPVTAGVRRLDMDGGGGFTSRRVSSGLGVRDYRAESNGSWWELAGVSYENATFAGPAATAEKVELRGLSMRHFLFASEHDMTLDAETNIGGAWVWDAGRQRQVSTVAGRAGLVARLITNGERRDWFEIGAAVARDAGWLGDGTGLTTSWRIEAPAEISMQGDRIGGAVRVAAESLEIPAGLAAGRDGWRATFTTEWHVALAQGVLVGFHHATTNACVVAGDAYCHVFGGFLRLTGAWPRRHEAAPAEEEPPRQVQDQEQPLVRPQP